jgi:hypothetical protein
MKTTFLAEIEMDSTNMASTGALDASSGEDAAGHQPA